MSFVVEVETNNGVRRLYGPVASMREAQAVALWFLDQESTVRTMAKQIEPAPFVAEPTDPNQTTIQDHIADIHDAVI